MRLDASLSSTVFLLKIRYGVSPYAGRYRADIVVLEQPWNAAWQAGKEATVLLNQPGPEREGSQNRRIEESYVSAKLHRESKVLLA